MTLLTCLLLAAEFREGRVEVPGASLHYVDSGGSRPVVVFLHAATGSVPMWRHQEAAAAQAGLRFVAYDRRGHGRTTVLPTGGPGTAADDLKALLDRLQVDRVHLVAAAAGGGVAVDFALAYPARVRSLVLACTLGGVEDESFRELGRRLRPAPFATLPPELIELGPEYRAANPAGTEEWKALVRASHVARVVQPAVRPITLAAYEKLRMPVLGIAGGADLYSPPAVMRLFLDRVPGARLVTLPLAGHSAYWEEPEAFNRALVEFWRGVK